MTLLVPSFLPRGPDRKRGARRGSAVPLIRPQQLAPLLSFGRPSRKYIVDPALGMAELSADRPAWTTTGRLLLEGQTTNEHRNPYHIGAVAAPLGSPGTLPDNWRRASANGVQVEVAGVGTFLNMPYIDIRFAGTASATSSSVNIGPELTSQIVAAVGQSWAVSLFGQIVNGALPATNRLFLQIAELNSSGGYLTATNVPINPTTAALSGQRFASARVLSNANVGLVTTILYLTCQTGEQINFTLRIALWQMEQHRFATSPILPPAGTKAASTSAQDRLFVTGAPWLNPRAGTVVVFFYPLQAVADTTVQTLFQLSDGTSANRLQSSIVANALSIGSNLVQSGQNAGRTDPGLSPAVVNRFAIAHDTGRIYTSLNGSVEGAYGTGAGSGMQTVNRLDIGALMSGGAPLFAEIERMDYYPTRLPTQPLTTSA